MYSFVHEGVTYKVCILDTYNDYVRLTYKDENCVYYITKWRVFVLRGYVFAKGNLRDAWQVEPMHILDYASSILPKTEPINMNNRRKYQHIEERPTEEVKKENPEWFVESVESMEFKTADTNETVLELSVPTADELDSYFSSIGFNLGI